MLKIGSLYKIKPNIFRYNDLPTHPMWSYEAKYNKHWKEYRYEELRVSKKAILLYLGEEPNCKQNDNNLIFLFEDKKCRINSSSVDNWDEITEESE